MDSDGVSWLRGSILGKGAFGSVFLATSKPISNSRKKTTRCFPPTMAVKSALFDASDSLQKEKEVLCNLRCCPHVVKCFGDETTFGTNGGDMVYNVLLEYASGGTLAHSIKKSHGVGLSELEVRRYTNCILQGLDEVHDCGYVHCDLKPDNVLLFPGRGDCGYLAKIGDFGLARRERQSKRQRLDWSSCLRGTAMYMAPETVVDHVQQPPSDVWSLGCVVLEMLTGNKPWTSKQNRKLTSKEVLNMIRDENLLPEIPSGVSTEARDFLQGCLVRKPEFRLTAETLLDHPFVQGFDGLEFETEDVEDDHLEDGLDFSDGSSCYDSQCSSVYSTFTLSLEEDYDCVGGNTLEDDDLFAGVTQPSSTPVMQWPSVVV